MGAHIRQLVSLIKTADQTANHLMFGKIRGRSHNVFMEQVFLGAAVVAIAYHVISSARRQTGIRDQLEEQTRLLRAAFPGILSLNNDIARITTRLESLEKGLLGVTVRVAGDEGEVRFSRIPGQLERVTKLLSDMLYEMKTRFQ